MGSDSIYWKSAESGTAETFRQFLHQLRSRIPGKTLALILDNVSYHSAKNIREFLADFPDLKLFSLPTYSPEYNPTEQIWRWAKPLVHAAKTIDGGIEELLSRFRRLMRARLNGRLAVPLNIGIGIWNDLI